MADDVQRIIGQAVAEANAVGLPVNIVVVDREGRVLGTHTMLGARAFTRVRGGGRVSDGIEGLCIAPSQYRPDVSPQAALAAAFDPAQCPPSPPSPLNGGVLAAMSKAGTAAFFSTQGNAFSTRTAGFIIQEHFPPLIINASGGPLFGVQFSQLPCGNVIPYGQTYPSPPLPPLPAGTLPLGLSADPGGLPLYAGGQAAGGVGVEGDGRYSVDRNPGAGTVTLEERIAVAATRGFEAPDDIRGDKILLNGLRFPFVNVEGVPDRRPAKVVFGPDDVPPMDTQPSRFMPMTLGGVRGTIDPQYFPAQASQVPAVGEKGLTATEVSKILGRGARQADRTRAAIRRPLGDRARVNITVVDRGGNVLGIFRTQDAPTFGFDVSAQKARTALSFSSAGAGAALRAADAPPVTVTAPFVHAAARDGLRLDGSVAFSDRAQGFLSRPFFPDGIDATVHGPFSVPIGEFSVFNTGLQINLARGALFNILTLNLPLPTVCSGAPGLGNGIQIFAGSVPLYRGETLVGAVGVSGDGIEQDDLVAYAAGRGFRAPSRIRADRVHVRGVRLPFVKFPRRPITR
jgi:uncharacterized protein GlcG (DUF336 family)